jgi:hypothetical protein
MSDVALGKSFIEQAHSLRESGHVDAAAVLMTLAGAVLEGQPVTAKLACICAIFATVQEAQLSIPPTELPGLISNAAGN